jgi:succinyl-CoA synthetase beta subunit
MRVYNEVRAEQFLSKYLKTNTGKLTKKVDEALDFSKKYNYPLVLKIISDQLLHKSTINGVRIINNEQELRKNYEELLKLSKKKKLRLDGILIQVFISGKEIIIGGKGDDVFGQVILFGGGGIFAEVLKDFSLRICPINEKDAEEMIKETKFYHTLNDLNLKQIINSILKVNEIMIKHPEIIELDINPLIINEKNAIVADARIVMD